MSDSDADIFSLERVLGIRRCSATYGSACIPSVGWMVKARDEGSGVC